MVLLTCVDVVGRYFLNRPLTGAFELTEHAMGALVFSSLPLVALSASTSLSICSIASCQRSGGARKARSSISLPRRAPAP